MSVPGKDSTNNDHYPSSSTSQQRDHHSTTGTSTSNYKGKGNKTPIKDSSSSSSETRNWKRESGGSSNNKTTSSLKSKTYHSYRATSPNSGGISNNYSSSRYYYRDMPPRFQSHNKKLSSGGSSNGAVKTTPTSKSQQGNSKKSKDSRWSSSSDTTTSWTSTASSSNNTTINPDTTNHSSRDKQGGGEKGEVWSNNNSSWNNQWISDEDESFSNSDPIADEIVVTNHDLDSFSTTKSNETNKKDLKNEWSSSSEHKKLSPSRNDIQSPESLDSEPGQEGDGVWRSGRNSMGSTSSIGSNSSWKGSGTSTERGGNRMSSSSSYHHHRSASPRKQVYSSQRSSSVSSNSNGGGGGNNSRSSSTNRFAPKKKPIMDLDDAIESLHYEPSGWGDLPSPKQTGIDMGTDLWGIPDDMKQKMKKTQNRRGGWSDSKSSTNDWNDVSGRTSTNGTGWIDSNSVQDYQWGEEGDTTSGWTGKGKERSGLGDKIKTLVDMGFSPSSCEKALKVNNNNLEGALGDLLAITAIKENETGAPSPPPPSSTTIPATVSTTISSGHPSLISPLNNTGSNTSNSISSTVGNQWQQLPNTGGLDLINIQQILGQQLTQYRLLKQKLMIQMSQLKSTALTSQQLQKQQQFLTANMNQVNSQITTVYQQYVAITKLIQQKVTSVDHNEKDSSVNNSDTIESTTSTCSNTEQQLNTPMQNMSLQVDHQNDISKSTARTLSRLQQIINSQESEEELSGSTTATTMIETPPIAPPTSSTMPNRFSAVRSVDDIPEFRPGVPWRPSQSSSTVTTPSDFSSGSSNSLYEQSMYQSASGSRYHTNYGNNSSYEQNYNTVGNSGPKGFPSGSFNRSVSYTGYAGTPIGGGGGYKNGVGGFNSSTQQKIPPLSPSQNYLPNGAIVGPSQPQRSSSHRPRLLSQNSYNGPFNNSGSNNSIYRPNNTTSNTLSNNNGSNQRTQYNGGSHGKWSFDGNPWGMPATSGSIWSMESSDPSSILNSTAVGGAGGVAPGYTTSTSTDWRNAGGRKPSLPLQLSAPTNYLLLKNVTSQIDETSLREVCSEYGQVLSCSKNPFNESVLIKYTSKEDAALAKAGLEKNPSICGIHVSPNFASEIDITSFTDQRTPSHHHSSLSLSSALEMTSPSWLPPQQQSHKKAPPTSLWGNNPPTAVPNSEPSSSSSVWSNGGSSGTLGSLTSPWSTISPSFQHQQQVNRPQNEELISTSPPMSTFLPNGLF